MPFTPAHPAIILPLLKIGPRYVAASGLVIGSMAPDFEYFFKMSVSGEHSHTLPGLLYFDVPVTLVLAFVFHLIVKRNLIDNLPAFVQRRFQLLRGYDFSLEFKKYYPAFLLSALVGSASHIFWDGFTHAGGFFVKHLAFYRGSYVPFDNVDYPLWYALQHISTAVGLTAVSIFVLMIKPQAIPAVRPSVLYWLVVVSVILLVMGLRFNFQLMSASLGNLVVSAISALCIGLIVAGWLPFQKSANQSGTNG